MSPGHPIRLGVLISGQGRTLRNLCERIADGSLAARIQMVVSSRPNVYGLTRAAGLGLPVRVVDRRRLAGGAFDATLTEVLTEAGVDLVCMAGFLSLWTVPPCFAGCVMNIHPALLPNFGGKGFYGRRVHEAVLAAGVSESGCTVHYCDNLYDHGPIVLQRRVAVRAGDTADKLAARVFEQECVAYPQAIRLHAAGRLRIEGGRVVTLDEASAS